jgi:hypothetical protein
MSTGALGRAVFLPQYGIRGPSPGQGAIAVLQREFALPLLAHTLNQEGRPSTLRGRPLPRGGFFRAPYAEALSLLLN